MKGAFLKYQLLLYFLVLGCQHQSFSQLIHVNDGEVIKPPKFEFGMAPYSFVVGQQDILNGKSLGNLNYFANGLFARFWIKKINYRLSFNHYVNEFNFPDYRAEMNYYPFMEGDFVVSTNYNLNAATRKAYEFKCGWQQFITHTRVSPYITADVGYTFLNENVFYSEEKAEFGRIVHYNYISRNVAMRVGVYGGLGLRLKLTRFLSLSFETQASLNYDWKKTNRPNVKVKNGLNLGLFPAQFLLGYYF